MPHKVTGKLVCIGQAAEDRSEGKAWARAFIEVFFGKDQVGQIKQIKID